MNARPLVALLIAGCTVEGEATPGQVVDCTDVRDGERFTLRSDNVDDARIGIAGAASCLTGLDDNGTRRTLCSDQAQFLKCIPRK